MYFVSYKVENTTLHISSSPYWKSELDLNKLISVKKRENGGLKRFFGMPKTTIELYMERDGHMELWTDNEKLFESLKAFERAGNTSLYTSRLSG